MYPYNFYISNIGEFLSSGSGDDRSGRLIKKDTVGNDKSVLSKLQSTGDATFNGQYVCYYTVDCPDCQARCELGSDDGYESLKVLRGDLNADGKANNRDVVGVMKIRNNSSDYSKYRYLIADVNNDGAVDDKDVELLMKCVIGSNCYFGDVSIPYSATDDYIYYLTQYFKTSASVFSTLTVTKGDLNMDSRINNRDVVELMRINNSNHLGTETTRFKIADVDNDGNIDNDDVTYLQLAILNRASYPLGVIKINMSDPFYWDYYDAYNNDAVDKEDCTWEICDQINKCYAPGECPNCKTTCENCLFGDDLKVSFRTVSSDNV